MVLDDYEKLCILCHFDFVVLLLMLNEVLSLTNSNWILYRANSAISKAFGFEIRIKIVTLHIPPFAVTITVSFLLHIPFLYKLTISYTTHISTGLKYKYFCKVIGVCV